jgi:hypothetical protein
MTRQWTRDALDAAHPEVKAAGWEWKHGGDKPTAIRANYDGDAGPGDWHVWVDECDTVCSMFYYRTGGSEPYDPPTDIALAVALASRGMDSLGAMAAEIDRLRDGELARIAPLADAGRHERAYHADGAAGGFRIAAAMLRRGTVNP